MITLSPFAREIMDASMAWMDARFVAEAGLLYADGAGMERRHIVRESTYYALGLLARSTAGRAFETAKACCVLHAVLDHQFDEPGAVYHGTFLRFPEEARPGEDAWEWRDYDPNWRDFIGTGLALALIYFEDRLPAELVARIERSFRLAVEGTLARAVRPGYSNIALMDAFLLHYAGQRLNQPDWCMAGERLGQQVYDLFCQAGAFEEYNSPTYYGVDLYALGLWRGFSGSALLRALGSQMEAALWRDIAAYYHAGLRNAAGPWDRSYGMDMTRYAALLGLWIWLGVGRERAPFPDPTRPFEHAFDLCFGPCAALVGTEIPADALAHLRAFQGERRVEHKITEQPLRIATAWLGENVMLGAESTGRAKAGYAQFHPLTMHWRTSAGEVGWAKLVHVFPVDVVAAENTLELAGQGEMVFRVYSPGKAVFAPREWRLDGLVVTVEGGRDEGFSVTRGREAGHPELEVWEVHYGAGPAGRARPPLDAAGEEEELKMRLEVKGT